jgi:hypothetical protein
VPVSAQGTARCSHDGGRREQRHREQHDRAARRGVGVVRRRRAADAHDEPDDDGQHQGGPEAAGDELRGRHRHDHEGADEQQPDHAHADDHGRGGDDGQQEVDRQHWQSNRSGVLLVVAHGEQPWREPERGDQDEPGQHSEGDEVAA